MELNVPETILLYSGGLSNIAGWSSAHSRLFSYISWALSMGLVLVLLGSVLVVLCRSWLLLGSILVVLCWSWACMVLVLLGSILGVLSWSWVLLGSNLVVLCWAWVCSNWVLALLGSVLVVLLWSLVLLGSFLGVLCWSWMLGVSLGGRYLLAMHGIVWQMVSLVLSLVLIS